MRLFCDSKDATSVWYFIHSSRENHTVSRVMIKLLKNCAQLPWLILATSILCWTIRMQKNLVLKYQEGMYFYFTFWCVNKYTKPQGWWSLRKLQAASTLSEREVKFVTWISFWIYSKVQVHCCKFGYFCLWKCLLLLFFKHNKILNMLLLHRILIQYSMIVHYQIYR